MCLESGMPAKKHPTLRYKDKYEIDPITECWNWTAYRYHGYGILSVNRHPTKAHRFVYETLRGPVPAGAILCHKCDNRACVNPDHLYVGTYRDNNRDILERRGHHNSNRTHCTKGHPFNEANTRIIVKRGRPTRQCIECTRTFHREYQRKLREQRFPQTRS
jgi:hypothetical protein